MKGGTIYQNTKDISIVSRRRYAQLFIIIRLPVNPVILLKLAVQIATLLCVFSPNIVAAWASLTTFISLKSLSVDKSPIYHWNWT